MTTKISIIIPVYNAEKHLSKCLESISSQSFKDYEVLIINDGSTDNSQEIIDSYVLKDCRFKGIKKRNEGVSVARNAGIQIASGEYIYFIDSDDYLMPYSLERMVEFSEKGYDMISFNSNRVDVYGQVVYTTKSQEESIDLSSSYLKYKFILQKYMTCQYGYAPWNKLYRTSIIKENNLYFPPNITLGEDFIFNLCYIYYIKNFKNINQVLYNYQITENSITYKAKLGYCINRPVENISFLYEKFHNDDYFSKLYPLFYVKIFDMELCRLRDLHISPSQISKLLYLTIQEEGFNIYKKFVHQRKFAKLMGYELYYRLQYFSVLYLRKGKKILCIPEYLIWKIYLLKISITSKISN